jgi:hypothetical protein
MSDDKTLHIATEGYYAPSGNDGSNPLAQASDYHLGPDAGIFGVGFSPDLGLLHFSDHFNGSINSLEFEVTNADLTIVSGHTGDVETPFDFRIRIGGISYRLAPSLAKRIRGKNGGRVYWRSTRYPTESDSEGSFRFFRGAPPVFR